jgi:hypothetical protein
VPAPGYAGPHLHPIAGEASPSALSRRTHILGAPHAFLRPILSVIWPCLRPRSECPLNYVLQAFRSEQHFLELLAAMCRVLRRSLDQVLRREVKATSHPSSQPDVQSRTAPSRSCVALGVGTIDSKTASNSQQFVTYRCVDVDLKVVARFVARRLDSKVKIACFASIRRTDRRIRSPSIRTR